MEKHSNSLSSCLHFSILVKVIFVKAKNKVLTFDNIRFNRIQNKYLRSYID